MVEPKTRGERRPGVATLDRTDFARAGRVLGRAFSEDPLWSALMPDPGLRSRMFAGAIRMIVAGNGTAESTPNVAAVALWMPPGRELGMGAFVRSGFAPMRWLVKTPWRDLKRLTSLQREIPEQRKMLMSEPHWCLEVLGVDPGSQGTGLGTALVEAGLGRADAEGTPVYVDTTEERNLAFYARFGFELAKEITVTDRAVPFWMMIRSAARESPRT